MNVEQDTKRVSHVRDMEDISGMMRSQKAYVDGLFLSYQAQTICREHVPETHHELVALATVAREMANEIDTLLGIERRFQEEL